MNDILERNFIPATANYVQQGSGTPVILIHGIAASLHDWDDLIPVLARKGYAAYALDLLGHGDSPKLDARLYQMDWVFEHFFYWMKSLRLTEPAILIGHSLGGHVALEYARRVSAWTRGLILVNPFYSPSQLPFLVRKTYGRPRLNELLLGKVSEKWFRFLVDVSSAAIGHSIGALRALPERIREQTILDYKRVAPGVYHIPSAITDLTERMHDVNMPTLVIWGDQDKTLSPASFPRLVNTLPKARGEILRAGHVPHQSHAEQFNQLVLKFLEELP
ncbi:MAG TPA: alpha/beta hydrolase [Anaerolineales bacterium]|nr:alpha/beta hydrolase [Anaerolineales bacterium]